jgi:putative SOS response-associated peptidase YedK
MCYYNGQKVTKAEYIRLKQLEKLVADYDFLQSDLLIGFDYKEKAVLKRIPDKEDFEIVKMEWGFRAPFWKTEEEVMMWRKGFMDQNGQFRQLLTLNAMAEELLLPKKIYRTSALQRRCLILSTGFYEWRHIHRINKRTGQPNKTAEKYPYFISLKDKEYFYIAGIWTPWTDQVTGEYVESCAIVTTTAVGHQLMEQVHNSKKRMPTILNEDLGYEWLFGNLDENRITEIAKTQYPSEEMQAWSINKTFLNSLCPADPVAYPELPPLEGEEGGATGLIEQASLF